jgi:hypothetical protein
MTRAGRLSCAITGLQPSRRRGLPKQAGWPQADSARVSTSALGRRRASWQVPVCLLVWPPRITAETFVGNVPLKCQRCGNVEPITGAGHHGSPNYRPFSSRKNQARDYSQFLCGKVVMSWRTWGQEPGPGGAQTCLATMYRGLPDLPFAASTRQNCRCWGEASSSSLCSACCFKRLGASSDAGARTHAQGAAIIREECDVEQE